MQEYVTEAIVLHQEPNGDLDGRCVLFTKHFGKISGKVKSVRKITSKLAGHLQPGNRVAARFVETGGLQIVDALKTERLAVKPGELYFLQRLLSEGEPDLRLWQELTGSDFSWRAILKLLGWDPAEARCASGDACPLRLASQDGRGPELAGFSLGAQEFFCVACASKIKPNEIIYI